MKKDQSCGGESCLNTVTASPKKETVFKHEPQLQQQLSTISGEKNLDGFH